jgi:hypothetical protein
MRLSQVLCIYIRTYQIVYHFLVSQQGLVRRITGYEANVRIQVDDTTVSLLDGFH